MTLTRGIKDGSEEVAAEEQIADNEVILIELEDGPIVIPIGRTETILDGSVEIDLPEDRRLP